MSTLLLRLAAPMQSWGADAKFDRRGTERVPTKSGVIGLVAAALGRRRYESIEDLRALRFGVRVDREGSLLRDYHIAKSMIDTYVTYRYYLADAVFLAGLEGDESLLGRIDCALHRPAFPLSLGRRSCPPAGRLSLGVRSGKSLSEALQEEPWLGSEWLGKRDASPKTDLHISMDADESNLNAYFQRDDPVSYNQTHRRFDFRRVCDFNTTLNRCGRHFNHEKPTQHDSMLELGEES